MDKKLEQHIIYLLETYPESVLRSAINKYSKSERELTVVVNFGMHSLPEDVLRGETFFFSEGNVDLTQEGVGDTISTLTKRALKFLRGKL